MTTILIKEIKNGKSTNNVLVKDSKKPIFYEDRELKVIDYRETTADKYFCDITFKDNNKTYCIPSHKLNVKDNI